MQVWLLVYLRQLKWARLGWLFSSLACIMILFIILTDKLNTVLKSKQQKNKQ